MAELQYRTIKEEKVRQDVVSSNGYCNFHFHQMARLASPVGNAFLTKELIETEIKGLETGSLTREVDCAVCQYIAEREDFYLEEFKTFLEERSFQKEYESTDGLCLVHFRSILSLTDEKELRQFLLTTQVMHLKLLSIELETFMSKVRSTSRNMGHEKNAWWFAIEKWVGKKGLRIRSQ